MRNCVHFIVNFAQVLAPFLPFSTAQVQQMLEVSQSKWNYIAECPACISNVSPLFERIDVKKIEEEVEKLYGSLG
ncbi:hypothetical protein BACCIP111899_01667 [Bacillus rhizoplanae]|uniref:Uncharacterized protein n=1 Tax=Bacillus rhizoplanae TaxID=2880966 RepID=A0ABN7ZYU5_9BACI|nr:hypothetical protein BACCIP111899_01667 [Bacillus rhizoplanae]